MSFYIDLQDELVDRLNAWFLAKTLVFKAVSMPETDAEGQDILDTYRDTPIACVTYNDSVYKDSDNVNHVVQGEVVSVAILLINYLVSSDTGIYEMQSQINQCLLGFNPSNCSKRLMLQKFQKVDWSNFGIYNTIFFNTERPVVQYDDEEIILGPHFKTLTVIE